MSETAKKLSKIEVYTNSLYPGMILKSELYAEQGDSIYPSGKPITQEFINMLLSKNIKKIYYEKAFSLSGIEKEQIIPLNVLEKALSVAGQIEYAVVRKTPLPEKDIVETVEQFVENITKAEGGVSLNLVEMGDYDERTYIHEVNVSMLAVLFGKLMGWKRDKIRMLGIGALLHDIGKTMVSKEILNKNSPLTKEEYDIIKKHPVFGYNILKNQSGFDEQIWKIALMHHECCDGSGYPLGITSEKIDDMAQIVSLCDFYEAVTSDKAYRNKMAYWKAFLMIRQNMGNKFNPRFAIEFINRMSSYLVQRTVFSVGQFVLLNTGEKARIAQLSPVEALKPQIAILIGPAGDNLRYQLQIDLNKDNTRWIETIIEDEKTLEILNSIYTDMLFPGRRN